MDVGKAGCVALLLLGSVVVVVGAGSIGWKVPCETPWLTVGHT